MTRRVTGGGGGCGAGALETGCLSHQRCRHPPIGPEIYRLPGQSNRVRGRRGRLPLTVNYSDRKWGGLPLAASPDPGHTRRETGRGGGKKRGLWGCWPAGCERFVVEGVSWGGGGATIHPPLRPTTYADRVRVARVSRQSAGFRFAACKSTKKRWGQGARDRGRMDHAAWSSGATFSAARRRAPATGQGGDASAPRGTDRVVRVPL